MSSMLALDAAQLYKQQQQQMPSAPPHRGAPSQAEQWHHPQAVNGDARRDSSPWMFLHNGEQEAHRRQSPHSQHHHQHSQQTGHSSSAPSQPNWSQVHSNSLQHPQPQPQQQQQQYGHSPYAQADGAYPTRPSLNDRRGSSPGLRSAAEELSRELGLSFDPWSPDQRPSSAHKQHNDTSGSTTPSPTSAVPPPEQTPASYPLPPASSTAALDGATPGIAANGERPRPTVDTALANRKVATLHLGDLDYWMMDEMYISRCVSLMGWDVDGKGNSTRVPVSVKMIHGNNNSTSGYCFLRFPTHEHAVSVMDRYQSEQLRTLMPGSERTFKLNWATGMPGAAPSWENEFSIFVGDLSREVSESELVSLFAPLFPSCQSAKVMYDSGTGHSKGYGFVRFSDESDRTRALALGKSGAGAGLTLRGRTLRISEASTPASASAPNFRGRQASDASSVYSMRTVPSYDSLFLPDERQRRNSYASSMTPSSASSQATSFAAMPEAMLPSTSPSVPFTSDPSNTTVFVGGLPAAITEGELHAMFQDFGPIAYVKIPNSLGCGFVQFANRSDAEGAIVKMQNFPVNANARIRLAWGRSATDKHLEQVKKLSLALGMPFDNVLKMVESQDRGTVKNITSAVAQHFPPGVQGGDVSPSNMPYPSRGGNFDSARYPDGHHNMAHRPSLERYTHRATMPSIRHRPSLEQMAHRHSFDNTPFAQSVGPAGAYSSQLPPPMSGHAPSSMGPTGPAGMAVPSSSPNQLMMPRGSGSFLQQQQQQAPQAVPDEHALQAQMMARWGPPAAAPTSAAAHMMPPAARNPQEDRFGMSFTDMFGDMSLSAEPRSYT